MTIIATLAIALPLLILLLVEVQSGAYRKRLAPFMAVAGMWLFTCVGSFGVLTDPSLYSDRYVVSMVVVNVACWVCYVLLARWPGRSIELEYREAQTSSPIVVVTFFAAMLSFSAAAFALYYSRHGPPPLLAFASSGGLIDVYVLRAERTTNVPEGMSWYVLGLQTIPFVIFAYAYVLHLVRRTKGTRLLLAATAVVTVGCAALFANKSVVLEVMGLIIVTRICVGGETVKFRRLAFYMIIGLGSVFPFLRLYLIDRGMGDVARLYGGYLLQRIVVTYAEAHAYIVQIFPSELPYLNGRTLPNPGGLLPFTPVNLSQLLGLYTSGNIANYSAPSFSRGYADFGYAGIILVIAFVFVQAAVLQAVFRRLPHQPIFMAVYVVLTARMVLFGASGVIDPLAFDILFAMVVAVFLHNGIVELLRVAANPPGRPIPTAT